jgi:hypothetical protein
MGMRTPIIFASVLKSSEFLSHLTIIKLKIMIIEIIGTIKEYIPRYGVNIETK